MKKAMSVLLASVLSLGMMAGCGSSAPANPAPAAPAAPTASAAPEAPATPTEEPVTITWWAFPTFATVDGTVGKYEQSLIDEFNKTHPNITVKLEMIDFTSGPEKILTAIAGKTAPDVLFDAPGRIVDYGNRGVLADLNDMFTDDFKKDVGNEGLLAACKSGDNYYMYPLSSAPFVMVVNGTILEKEGLMDMINLEGDRTWNVDQFTKLNQALKDKGYKNAIVFSKDQGGDQGTRAFVANLYSSTITNKELTAYTINDANGIKAAEYVKKALDAGELENGITYNGGESITAFYEGKVSQCLLWSPGQTKNWAEQLKANNVKAIALPLPSDDSKPTATEFLLNGFGVFNNGDAKKIAASKEFVKFLCDDGTVGPQNVLATNAFPVRSSLGNLYGDDADMKFYASMSQYYGTYYNTMKGFAKMRPFWWSNLQAMTTGDKTPQQAMDDFVKDATAAIND